MLVAGLMSGTSADAVDVAFVDITKHALRRKLKYIGFHSVPYTAPLRRRILSIASGQKTSAQDISQLNFLLGEVFARAVLDGCRRLRISTNQLQLIGSHGQTIHHQPKPKREVGIPIRSTLQIGEPAVIAARIGVCTIADFRPADMAAGGQGAPLVPFFDYLQFRHPRLNRVVLNIGGIANISYLPARAGISDVLAFDTGPGNMVIDQLAHEATAGQSYFDRGGDMARRGHVNEALVRRILREPFFARRPPKSTGRELFGRKFVQRWFPLKKGVREKVRFDALATATALTASSIAYSIRRFISPLGPVDECLVSGGGIHNKFLMQELARRLKAESGQVKPLRVISMTRSEIPSKAKEAAAFALLAYETWHGRASNVPSATGASKSAVLGKIVGVAK